MNNLDVKLNYYPARTSIKQISRGLKLLIELIQENGWKGVLNLDYGGGKYDLGTEYLKEHGINNLIYDPYARNFSHNKDVLFAIKNISVDTVTLLNVLNTIKNEETRINVLQHAFKYLKPGGFMIVTIYPGKGNGVGILSKKKTWQENRSLTDYYFEIIEALGNVEIVKYKNSYLIYKD